MGEKTKHTPGPWYSAGTGNHQGLVISESTSGNVAVCYNGGADAYLIAAAPELLEALEELAAECMDTDGATVRPFRVTVNHALAIIAKAKGEV